MIKKTAIAICCLLVQIGAYAQQTYQLDLKKSKLNWDNRKIMGGHHGFILFSAGTLNYNFLGKPESGLFTIDMNSLRSTDEPKPEDNAKTNKKLRTPSLFSVDQYPTATMTVKKISAFNDAGKYTITGDLTIKGITNPIEFIADIKPKGNTITATANIEFDRNKWKIDLQENQKQWNFFDAIKDVAVPSNIAIALYLVFEIK